LERADSVSLLSNSNKELRQAAVNTANATSGNDPRLEPTFNDPNDDEVRELTSGKENQGKAYFSTSNSKPGLLPDAKTTAFNSTLKLGLPDRGAFSDPHDGQKEAPDSDKKPPVSTQEDLPSAHILHKSLSGADTASFAPISSSDAQYSSAFVDQQAAKSIGKEKI